MKIDKENKIVEVSDIFKIEDAMKYWIEFIKSITAYNITDDCYCVFDPMAGKLNIFTFTGDTPELEDEDEFMLSWIMSDVSLAEQFMKPLDHDVINAGMMSRYLLHCHKRINADCPGSAIYHQDMRCILFNLELEHTAYSECVLMLFETGK